MIVATPIYLMKVLMKDILILVSQLLFVLSNQECYSPWSSTSGTWSLLSLIEVIKYYTLIILRQKFTRDVY